jgi:hypothetical protein
MLDTMKNSFSFRKLTSFSLFLSLFMLLISGVILYIFPGASSSGLIGRLGGLTKPAWLNQHIIFGIVFALFSLYHLFFVNWNTFFSYLKKKTTEGRQSSAELLTTIMVILVIGIGTYNFMPPFSGILSSGKEISSSREGNDANTEGPVFHDKSTDVPQLSRHHDLEEDYDVRQGARHLAFRGEETEETAKATLDSRTDNNVVQSGNEQAPDDDLHRRTTASCASCH